MKLIHEILLAKWFVSGEIMYSVYIVFRDVSLSADLVSENGLYMSVMCCYVHFRTWFLYIISDEKKNVYK